MKTKLPTQEDIERLERDEAARRRPPASGRFERRRSDRAMKHHSGGAAVPRSRDYQGGAAAPPYLVFLALVALAFGLLVSRASAQMTITGRVRNSSGVIQPGTNVTFYPLSTPAVVNSLDVQTSTQVSTNTDSLGQFTVQLLAGDYRVVYGNWSRDAFNISVTNNSGSNAIGQITTTRLRYTALWTPGTNGSWPTNTYVVTESGTLLAIDP